MNQKYEENAKTFKALSDPGRLEIIEILSCGECAGSGIDLLTYPT